MKDKTLFATKNSSSVVLGLLMTPFSLLLEKGVLGDPLTLLFVAIFDGE